jgi:drug/metabolite transporter (DMT)-like permease
MKWALLKLHIAVLLVGFTAILGALISLSGIVLVWYRVSITVVSLFCLLRWQGGLDRISFKNKRTLMFIGVVIALHWVCFYTSIKMANVSIALVCFSATGFFTALIEPILVTKKLNYIELVLSLLSVLGIYLIFHFDDRYQWGIIIGIISSLLAALFSVLNKKNIAIANPNTTILYELAGGVIVLTLLMPIYIHYFPATILFPSNKDWIWLLILSWVCTILAMKLMLEALQHVSAFTQNLSLNMEPVYGILMAFLLFKENEQLNYGFYLGVSLIFLSVLIQTLLMYKKRVSKLARTQQ